MSVKPSTKNLMLMAAAFVAGGLLTASLFLTRTAGAEEPDCLQADMTFNTHYGQVGDSPLTVRYQMPYCLLKRGYRVDSLEIANFNTISVVYKK